VPDSRKDLVVLVARLILAAAVSGPVGAGQVAGEAAIQRLAARLNGPAKNAHQAALDQVTTGLREWAKAEAIPAPVLEAGLSAAAAALAASGLHARRIVELNMDPRRVSAAVLNQSARYLRDLSEAEEQVCRRAVGEAYRVLLSDQKLLPELDRAFKQAVLRRFDEVAASVAGNNPRPALERIETALHGSPGSSHPDAHTLMRALSVPAYQLPDRAPPSFLLRSDFEVVPFGGREGETASFLSWATADDAVSVRLCFAPGGQGKTRLAQQLVTRLARDGWVAGRLRPRYQEELLAQLLQCPADTFVVVDYAETQLGCLQDIMGLLARPRADGCRLRLLLMARSAGEWWDELQRRAPDPVAALMYDAAHELPPLFSEPGSRLSAFREAIAAFCDAGGYESTRIAPPPDLEHVRYARALTLHMTALAILLDHQQGWPAGKDAARLDPASRVLAHERNYWEDSARARKLPHTGQRLLDAVMTAATCCGSASRDEALDLLSGLPDLAGEHRRVLGQYADWAHQLHPGDGWLNPLEPDLLGEYFVAHTLQDQDDLAAALARSASTPDQMWQLVSVTTGASGRYVGMPEVITGILSAGNDKLWLTGAMGAAYLPDPSVLTRPLLAAIGAVTDWSFLWAAAREIPSSHRVSDLKIGAAQEALARYRSAPQRDPAVEAELTDLLSAGLYYDGQHDEVADVQRELIKKYAKLAKQDPRRYTAQLGFAMLNYGEQHLAPEEARQAHRLAGQVINMAGVVPADERPRLLSHAYSLRSMALKSLGQPGQALKAAERAVREARTAAQSSEIGQAWLPMEIMNLANRHSELGDHKRALETIQETVDLLREAETGAPDPLSPNMAEVLLNYAQCLSDCRLLPEACSAVAEAARRFHRLTGSHAKFYPKLELVTKLWWSYLQAREIDDEQVQAGYEQLIDLLKELGETDLTMRMAQAKVMSDYAARLIRAGDTRSALPWKTEAARLRRRLPDLMVGRDSAGRPTYLES